MKYAGVVWAVSAALAAGAASASGSPSGAVQARVLVNPLSVVVLVPSDPVKAGRNFRIRAEVTNASSSALRNVTVALVAPQALVVWRAPRWGCSQARARASSFKWSRPSGRAAEERHRLPGTAG